MGKSVLEPLFTEEEYKMFREAGLSEEEIATLERAEASVQSASVIPQDIDSVFNRIESLPDNPKDAMTAVNNMIEKDPNSFAEAAAVIEALDSAIEADRANIKY